jgi:phosphoglycerate dehydrogenase-like enzyme
LGVSRGSHEEALPNCVILEALVQALKETRIAGAALDVYDVEPLPDTHPLRTLSHVIATPHVGYVTPENYRIFSAMQ